MFFNYFRVFYKTLSSVDIVKKYFTPSELALLIVSSNDEYIGSYVKWQCELSFSTFLNKISNF